jgi:putative pyruvate formate lyase activating enzyme
MVGLESRGCHNINFVTPTHVTPQLMEAIALARSQGLAIPIVYNCGGYESVETLRLLEGFVDIYMPDAKFWDPDVSARYSHAPDYPAIMKSALTEMHRQVGDLVIENVPRGPARPAFTFGAGIGRHRSDSRVPIAKRGLLVRHLVMPNGLAGTRDLLDFIVSEISPETYINVMGQYRPCFQAAEHPPINRPPTRREFMEAHEEAVRRGLRVAR